VDFLSRVGEVRATLTIEGGQPLPGVAASAAVVSPSMDKAMTRPGRARNFHKKGPRQYFVSTSIEAKRRRWKVAGLGMLVNNAS
jgi:hypothetical protein